MKLEILNTENGTVLSANGISVVNVIARRDAEDSFQIYDDVICWIRRTAEPVSSMTMELETLYRPMHTLIPSVSYDGNAFGNDHEYKGYEKEGTPWTLASHRVAVPGGTASWNDKTGLALFGEDGPSCSIVMKENCVSHRLIWPETEEPYVLRADVFAAPCYGEMKPRQEFKAWIFLGDSCWKDMLSFSWKKNFHHLQMCRKAREIWKLSASYARKLYTEEDDGFKGFSIGYRWNGTEWVKRPYKKYEIGWCGQNASLAVSLMYDYQMSGCKESLDMAFSVLDAWISMAKSKDGYLLTQYDTENSLIDACNLGTAGCQFIEAYDQAKILGYDKPEYWKAALDICDFAVNRQQLGGRMGISWKQDGSLYKQAGTAGAFLILPLAEAAIRTGLKKYHVAAVRAYSFYFREFQKNGYGTSGALDTCCIDKESVVPLLKGGILLYEETGFEKYLDMAQEAAWYLSTWQYHQTVKYPAESILGQLNYDTLGGTVVSTSHQHMDSFALCYVNDLVKLAEYTGNEEWKQRALAIWYNGIQGISDGFLQIGNTGLRPAGSSDEGYCHTRWASVNDEKWGTDFGVSQWLVAWPCAFRLETLRKTDNWNWLDGMMQKGGNSQ